jgi:hypothetical protein
LKFAANLWSLSQKTPNPDTQKFAVSKNSFLKSILFVFIQKRILTHIEIRSAHDPSFKRLFELISGTTNDTGRVSSRSSSMSNSVNTTD